MSPERLKPITLTKEMELTLKDMEPDLATLRFELEKAKRAGIDVADMEKRFNEMKVLRVGLLREYT